MTDLSQLLRACKASPDDNHARLVLADWLDEHGDPERAEFIRLQCDARRPVPVHSYRVSGFSGRGPWRIGEQMVPNPHWYGGRKRKREEELLERHRERWLGSLAQWFHGDRFYRGLFVLNNIWDRDHPRAYGYWEYPNAYPRLRVQFLECLRNLSAEEMAWIESFQITFDSSGGLALREVSNSPLLTGIVRLSLAAGDNCPEDLGRQGDQLPRDEIQALLAVPDLPVLRRLSFANYAFTPDDIGALVAAPWFGQLTDLSLTHGWAGRSLCRHLAARKAPTALVCLRITDVSQGLDDAAVEALCGATCLTELRELDLSGNHFISDRGLRALADSPMLGRLRYLGLRPRPFAPLGDWGDFPRITPQGVAALQNSPGANGLQVFR